MDVWSSAINSKTTQPIYVNLRQQLFVSGLVVVTFLSARHAVRNWVPVSRWAVGVSVSS